MISGVAIGGRFGRDRVAWVNEVDPCFLESVRGDWFDVAPRWQSPQRREAAAGGVAMFLPA